MQKKYKFSVVVPIYNVERFLAETIDSVLAQDIGFEENIQMILVNDGSPDNSEEICLAYQKKYPKNIIYVKQENGGVSSARNKGMDYVEGKYVNFLDSDDKWSTDAFSSVYDFFEKHYDQIDLAACKQELFEAQTGFHPLSEKKFADGDRVTDILDHYDELQLHVTASFIKAEAMRSALFDTRLKYGEDALYVNEIILNKHKYGIVSKPTHYYRKRSDNSSAVQKKRESLEWYFTTPKLFYRRLMERSKAEYGEVIAYIQHLIAYEMQWRLKDKIHDILDEEQLKAYKEDIRELLQECDDDIIGLPPQIYVQQKLYLYSLKYGRDIKDELTYTEQRLFFRNLPLCDLQRTAMFSIDTLRVKDDTLTIDGQVWTPFYERLRFTVVDHNGKEYPVEAKYSTHKEAEIWNETMISAYVYTLRLPLSDGISYEVRAVFDDTYPLTPKLVKGKFAKLNDKLKESYYEENGYLITGERTRITAHVCTPELFKQQEKRFRGELEELLNDEELLEVRKDLIRESLYYRKKYFAAKRFLRKKIWLVTDRINLAGDNGEAFFKYLVNHKPKDVKVYFVISDTSKDYQRMKKIGKVLPYKSKKHKLYTLLADKIISSQGEDNIVNPFDRGKEFLGNLFHYKYVFLQHGIIKDDISGWLNKYNKNIDMFVTSAYPEYRSVLDCDYQYDESVVKLTGLPRYDSLVQTKPSQKSVLILPTWRSKLAIEMDPVTGERPYNPDFKQSTYYQFYQKLISDERLLAVMEQYGYTGKFCVHTNNLPNAVDFVGNDRISVVAEAIDYQKEFKENALMVTDYSSVAYDFAYLKKPVIYTQSDREEFFLGQVYDEGYWDYDTMGFGPVCKDYDTTVEAIIDMIRQDCRLDAVYEKRIEEFYYAFDQDNCKRVLEAVLSLDA